MVLKDIDKWQYVTQLRYTASLCPKLNMTIEVPIQYRHPLEYIRKKKMEIRILGWKTKDQSILYEGWGLSHGNNFFFLFDKIDRSCRNKEI